MNTWFTVKLYVEGKIIFEMTALSVISYGINCNQFLSHLTTTLAQAILVSDIYLVKFATDNLKITH